MDIFEDLRKIVGCEYISDMRLKKYRRKVLNGILLLDLDKYPVEQFVQLLEYIDSIKK